MRWKRNANPNTGFADESRRRSGAMIESGDNREAKQQLRHKLPDWCVWK
jgi:hypothetical protein